MFDTAISLYMYLAQCSPLAANVDARPELSPIPRSDSVTPTNELVDEESLTPKSVNQSIVHVQCSLIV